MQHVLFESGAVTCLLKVNPKAAVTEMLMERAGTVQIRGAIEQTLGDCACGGNVTAKRSQLGRKSKVAKVCRQQDAGGGRQQGRLRVTRHLVFTFGRGQLYTLSKVTASRG